MLKSLSTLFCNFLSFVSITALCCSVYATETFIIDSKDAKASPLVELAVGSSFHSPQGSFKIVDHIGQGRDATVYLVKDLESGKASALRVPRLFFQSSSSNSDFSKFNDLYSKQSIDSKLFLPIDSVLTLTNENSSFKVPGLLMPYAREQFKISTDSELERYRKIGPMLLSMLPDLFRIQGRGIKFNDLMLRNIVGDAGRFYIIDYDRVTSSVQNSFPGIDYVAPEFFTEKKLHITSDMFGLALSIANYLYNRNYDFRFHHYGLSPIERDIEKNNAEFAEFFEQFYFKKSFESDTFLKNKEYLINLIKSRSEKLKAELPIASYQSLQLVIDFLQATLSLDSEDRTLKIQNMANKHQIHTSTFFCRALF